MKKHNSYITMVLTATLLVVFCLTACSEMNPKTSNATLKGFKSADEDTDKTDKNETAEEELKRIATTTKKPSTTTKKPSTTTTKKQTVTDANAMRALDYLMGHLTYSTSQGKNWGTLNKSLWEHKKFQRRVYIPQKYEKGAWKILGLPEKEYSNTKLLDVLKKTGIWKQLLGVRTDSKGHIIYSSSALAASQNSGNSIVHGYAKGGTVHKTGRYLTDEKGEEIIITKQGILRPLSAGTSVIPADITERLYSMASNYDMGASSRIHGIDTSKLVRIGGDTISPIINCPITIEGNANEQDVINAINKTLPKTSKQVQNDIRKELRKSGR